MRVRPEPQRDVAPRSTLGTSVEILIRTLAPLLLALFVSGLIIWAVGVDPLAFYRDVLALGLAGSGWQRTLTAMAPLLIVALGLIIAFRAQLWNLGYAGAYVLAAAVVAGLAPGVMAAVPFVAGVILLALIAIGVGVALAALPAALKALHGTTEIITTLMMSFIAMGCANLLIKGPFQDPQLTVPQTRAIDTGVMLPYLPGTRVHIGVVIALALVVVFHFVLTRTSFGLRIDILGANPRAAAHAGIRVRRLTVVVLLLSTGMIALSAAIDMLGLWGYARADWNPGYGDKILPFVFLARLNPLGSIPLVACYAVLATGGTLAAQRAGLSVDFLLIIVALILFFMTVIELLGTRRDLGRSYLPRGLSTASQTKSQGA